MLKFLKAFSVPMCLPLALVVAAGIALGETPVREDLGTVETIEIFRGSDNQPVNAGTVLGGIAGGVIGHQIGSGRGNTAATIAGAIGGAVVGNEIEKKRVQGSRYRIRVRLDSGSVLTVEDTRDPNLRAGDRVRVENNLIYRI